MSRELDKLSATYRLQFRCGMDFSRAAELVPYLSRLGISHVYASPIFKAATGSSHGYDIVDYNRIDPELGGIDGFKGFAQVVADHGMGLILDFVPNHMSATVENVWWREVLEWGERSQKATYFDVDWSAPKLLIPILSKPYGQALAVRAFSVQFDAGVGSFEFVAGSKLPLSPPSYADILGRIGNGIFADLATRFAVSTPDAAPELKAELSKAAQEPEIRRAIVAALEDVRNDVDALHALHEAQIWRLAYWRTARETLTYRRFFEVADLIGMRMEQPTVFQESHKLLLALISDGLVSCVRLDHVDGLADPTGYFQRLQQSIGRDSFPLLVEKILAASEKLRGDWPVLGTTGYEFCRRIGGLLTAPEGESPLTRAYYEFIGEDQEYQALLRTTKRHILIRNLAGELDTLTALAVSIAENDLATRDFGRDTLRRAIIEIAVSLPVYRTYVDSEGAKEEDEALIALAVDEAKSFREVEDEAAIDFISRIWRLDVANPAQRAPAFLFATRLQQTTGPLMAKAVEDTLFYRYNRLIALNEVGGSPDAFGCDVSTFHAEMMAQRKRQPLGLVATSTHDTKRGEDARARIYAISEAPEHFAHLFVRWREMNAGFKMRINDELAPSANDEWLFYQSLIGAWPQDLMRADAEALECFRTRMEAFMQKAAREAKVRTTWTAIDEAYEESLRHFVRGVLSASNSCFLNDFTRHHGEVALAGALNSLSQTLIKLAAPGVPDIYQGAELWDFSLVDPDNRRPVDFEARIRLLDRQDLASESVLAEWKSGLPKLHLIRSVLAERRRTGSLFNAGTYEPLSVEGSAAEYVMAFLRREGSAAAIVVTPIRASRFLKGSASPLVPIDLWEVTRIAVPRDVSRWRNVVTQTTLLVEDGHVQVSDVLRDFPVAMLVNSAS